MESENFLLTIAVIAVLVSAGGLGFTYFTLDNFKQNWLTGFATSGTVNITVVNTASINFDVDSINWGSGSIDSGQTSATLYTGGAEPRVINGNWTAVEQGFRINNTGNTNLTINLSASDTVANFIGGTNPSYQWNVTDYVPGACTGGITLATFANTATGAGTLICDQFNYIDGADVIRVDIKVVIPYDAPATAKSNTITATASAAA